MNQKKSRIAPENLILKKKLSRALLHEGFARVLVSTFLRVELVTYSLVVELNLRTSGLVVAQLKYPC